MAKHLLFCLLIACSSGESKDKSSDSGTSDSGSPDTEDSPWSDRTPSQGTVDAAWAASWPEGVEAIGEGALLVRRLEDGAPMELAWAQQSSVACFPATQNEAYAGPHRLFVMQQAAEQSLEIRVEAEAGVDVSIYSIQQGTNSFVLPPDTVTAAACEASLSNGPGETESLSLWGPNNPYNLIVGVAGVEGQDSGRFLLEILPGD